MTIDKFHIPDPQTPCLVCGTVEGVMEDKPLACPRCGRMVIEMPEQPVEKR